MEEEKRKHTHPDIRENSKQFENNQDVDDSDNDMERDADVPDGRHVISTALMGETKLHDMKGLSDDDQNRDEA